MESNTSSPLLDNAEAKAAFRKPSNDTGSRHYRRRSPVGESSSPEKHERSSSPIPSREASRRNASSMRRMDEERDLDRDSGRNHHGRIGDKYRQSDRHSSRSSYDNNKLDNYNRRDKFMDEDERHYSKSSFHSGRESRSGTRYDHARKENEHYKSRHHSHGDSKYSRDRADGFGHWSMDKDRDERKEYRRGDKKNDRSPVYDSGLHRDKVGHRLSEMSKSNPEELVGQKYAKEEKRKLIDKETSMQMDRSDKQPREQLKERSVFTRGNEDSPAKKQKPLSLGDDYNKDGEGVKCSKRAPEPAGKVNTEQAPASGCTAADIDAARITALKAAESVNKNLMGTGYMSADQKKKLLWGNKKSTPAEEQSSHRWETVTFSDREQQEKFNKLMSLRLHWYIWPIVGSEGRSKSGSQTTHQSTEQRGQHREAEGSAARLGEAIHCWPSSERWSHCWTRSVTVATSLVCSCTLILRVLFYFVKFLLFDVIDLWFLRNIHFVWMSFNLLDRDENWHLWCKPEFFSRGF